MAKLSHVTHQAYRIAAVMMALLAAPASASSQCQPQHRVDLSINTVQGLPLVSVAVGGKEASLVLDIGSEQTILSPAAAERLGLRQYHAYPRTMRELNGTIVAATADFPLTAGGILLPNHGVLVGSLSLPALGETQPDGLLGADILSQFEVDLDLPNRVLHLYDRSPCPIVGPLWAQPYETIAANRSLHDRLFFLLALDGHRMAAFFDSGAQHSLVDERAARQVGVDKLTLMRDPAIVIRGPAGGAAPSHVHRFKRLVIANETLGYPFIGVTNLNLDDADLILGTDYLGSHRVWLSYGSNQIFSKRIAIVSSGN